MLPFGDLAILAEQIRGCVYQCLTMKNNVAGDDEHRTCYGTMAVDTTIQRLNAEPVSDRSQYLSERFRIDRICYKM